jgi:hypothetical protein
VSIKTFLSLVYSFVIIIFPFVLDLDFIFGFVGLWGEMGFLFVHEHFLGEKNRCGIKSDSFFFFFYIYKIIYEYLESGFHIFLFSFWINLFVLFLGAHCIRLRVSGKWGIYKNCGVGRLYFIWGFSLDFMRATF